MPLEKTAGGIYVPTSVGLDFKEINVDDYEVNGKRGRVISFKRKQLICDSQILQMGKEMLGFITEGEDNFDPSARYCLDFKEVDFVSSAALWKFMGFDRRHKEYRNKEALSMCAIRPEIYKTFAVTKLNRLFDCDYENRDEFLDSLMR